MTALNVKPLPPRLDLTHAGAQPASAAVSSWAEWVRFAVVAAEFGLLVLVIRLFELESARFGDLAVLMWIGFIVHHLLPLRLRMPFFVILSLAGLKLVAGGTIALCVTGGGLALITVCHLPVPFGLRVGLLLLAGALLACLRAGWLAVPIVPINPA